MNAVQIILTCPMCGKDTFEKEEDGLFKCTSCGHVCLPEEMCSKTENADATEWFGVVRWCDNDLESALEQEGYPATENNITKLWCLCNHHSFEDVMIERGCEHLSDLILQNDGWDEYDE